MSSMHSQNEVELLRYTEVYEGAKTKIYFSYTKIKNQGH